MDRCRPAFAETLEVLIRGEIGVEKALLLAREDKFEAQTAIRSQVGRWVTAIDIDTSDTGIGPAIWRLLELMWQLFGPANCVLYHFPGMKSLGQTAEFLAKQLTDHPELFSDPQHFSDWDLKRLEWT